jgi:flagellar basal body-associated protein FliL
MRKKNKIILIVSAVLAVILAVYFVNQFVVLNNSANETQQKDSIPEPTFEFGIRTDTFSVHKGEIQPNEIITNLLLKFNIPQEKIFQMVDQSKGVF